MAGRGRHLLAGDRWTALGARLLAPGLRRLLDRIDAGLDEGALAATLPDGTARRLGGRAAGPEAAVTLHRWRALARLAAGGSAGWYRAWADGDWSSPEPVALFALFMRNRRTLGEAARARGVGRAAAWLAHRLRRNSPEGARRNVAAHYDLGNDFYAAWLDETLSYSSAIFARADQSLADAQRTKIDRLLDRLDLAQGQSLIEVGCGWGGLLERAAERGLRATGITLSAEQQAHAERRLAGRAAVRLADYRAIEGKYDAVASVEMVEAVGAEYWPAYMAAIARALKPGGRAAIQYILIDDAIWDAYAASADFIQTYIFPGGMLVSERRFRAAAEAAGLAWRDRTAFGQDYAETLRRWRARFDAAEAEGRLPPGFDARFRDLWRYYLMYCEGGFRGGGIDVAQVTLVRT